MAHAGDPAAMTVLGSIARRQGDLDVSREWCERAAALGHAPALTALGLMSRDEGDDEAAVAIIEEAATRGDPGAMVLLGFLALTRSDAWMEPLERRASAWRKPSEFEEFEVAGRAQAGDPFARQLQFEAGLPSVFASADRLADMPMRRSDLVRAGLVGLTTAMNRFNRERGYRFSAYSQWWVRQNAARRRADGWGSPRVVVEEMIVVGDTQLATGLDLGVHAGGADEAARWFAAADERESAPARDALAWLSDWREEAP